MDQQHGIRDPSPIHCGPASLGPPTITSEIRENAGNGGTGEMAGNGEQVRGNAVDVLGGLSGIDMDCRHVERGTRHSVTCTPARHCLVVQWQGSPLDIRA